MGNYLLNVINSDANNISDSVQPSTYNWLSVHAMESELTLFEVHRLWKRFCQLGCNTTTGVWSELEAKRVKSRITKSAFLTKIITSLTTLEKKELSFIEFLKAIHWLEVSTERQKLQAFYAMINNGQPIDEKTLSTFLTSMFHWTTQKTNLIVNKLYTDPVTNKKIEKIEENVFVNLFQSKLPDGYIDATIKFQILPNDVQKEDKEENKAENAKKLKIIPSEELPTLPNNNTVPSDVELQKIARLVTEDITDTSSGDYAIMSSKLKRLASQLGILEYDMTHLESIHRHDPYRITLSVLREWCLREGARAFIGLLRNALYKAGFTDIATDLELGQAVNATTPKKTK